MQERRQTVSQKTLTKVVKLPLIFLSADGFDGDIDYKKVNEILWKLQDEIRQVKNRSIRYFYEDSGLESGYFKKYLLDITPPEAYCNGAMKNSIAIRRANWSTTETSTNG